MAKFEDHNWTVEDVLEDANVWAVHVWRVSRRWREDFLQDFALALCEEKEKGRSRGHAWRNAKTKAFRALNKNLANEAAPANNNAGEERGGDPPLPSPTKRRGRLFGGPGVRARQAEQLRRYRRRASGVDHGGDEACRS